MAAGGAGGVGDFVVAGLAVAAGVEVDDEAAPDTSSWPITEPLLTLSPTFTARLVTIPT